MQTIVTIQWGRKFPGREIEWPTDATGASWGTAEGRAREREVFESAATALGLAVTESVQFFSRQVRTRHAEPLLVVDDPIPEPEPPDELPA